MLKQWSKLLTGNCVVVKIGSYFVYPIHKVGHTSLMSVAEKKYVNEHLSSITHIDVLWRNPSVRFVSGVNEYSKQKRISVTDTYYQINNHDLVDSHFMPQYVWLLNLYRFYKGNITIRPFEYIANITDVHEYTKSNMPDKVYVEPPERFVRVDDEIIKNTTVKRTYLLEDIIKDYKHVLS